MAHKITEPFDWYGHEVETMLATQSGKNANKELCIVTVVQEGTPKAFYRVKERGEKPQDFTNWLEAVDYYNSVE